MSQNPDGSAIPVHSVYFSPTGGTRRIVERVATGLGASPLIHHDLTRPKRLSPPPEIKGIAVIGAPVYAGRVAPPFLRRLEGLAGNGAPAVLVAVYGNRAFEDALVELRDLASAQGFRVVAAGAFVAEHSYASAEHPIAAGRPDAEDLRRAEEFGAAVATRLRGEGAPACPAIPGNVPYRAGFAPAGICPETDPGRCTLCTACEAACPTFAVAAGHTPHTNAAECVMCCACVRACPNGARVLRHPTVDARRELLVREYSARQEPRWFL